MKVQATIEAFVEKYYQEAKEILDIKKGKGSSARRKDSGSDCSLSL
jgi:hypothetical protein